MNAEIYHTTSSPKLITKNNPFIFAQSIMYIKMILNVNIFISTTKHPRMRKKNIDRDILCHRHDAQQEGRRLTGGGTAAGGPFCPARWSVLPLLFGDAC